MPAELVAARLLWESSTLTVTDGTIDCPMPTFVGCWPNASFVGVPTVYVTPAVWVIGVPEALAL